MTQTELIQLISKDTNLRYDAVRKVLRKLTKYTCVALENGEGIRIGLGTFHLKERRPKTVHNFQTGERFLMPPTNKLTFTPSTYVKRTIHRTDVELQAKYDGEQKTEKIGQ